MHRLVHEIALTRLKMRESGYKLCADYQNSTIGQFASI